MSHQEKEASSEQHTERVSAENDHYVNEKHAATDIAAAQQIASEWIDNTAEEKKLVRKLDWRILPCTWVLYLLGYLDRANIGYGDTRYMK